MATTSTWIQTKDHARIGFVLAIEGTNLIYTTIADANSGGADGIKAAWTGTDWASVTWRGGLTISGTMGQEIALFDPKIEPDSLTFIIADEVGSDTNIAQTLVRMASSTAQWSPLAADIDADDTSLTVKSVTALGAGATGSGTVYVGNETIDYGGVSSNTLTSLTRGKFNIWETDGGSRWSTAHKLSTQTENAPIVSDVPIDSYNRGVALYMHHFEDGAWSTRANAKKLWAGRIKSIKDKGNAFHVSAKNFSEVISRATLLEDQFVGNLAEGLWISSSNWKITIVEEQDSGGRVTVSADLFSGSATNRTAAEVANAINTLLAPSATLGTALTHQWSINLFSSPNEEFEKYRVHIVGPTTGRYPIYKMAMSPSVWSLLGWVSIDEQYSDTDSGQLMAVPRIAHTVNDAPRDGESLATLTPANSFPSIGLGATITLEDSFAGTFITQSNLPEDADLPSAVDGFLMLGDLKVVAVNQLTTTTYSIRKDLSSYFTEQGFKLSLGEGDSLAVVREGDGIGPIQAKQIWWETGKISDLILRAMLSTGTTDFNHATYDKNADGMALSVPANAIDINSFVSGFGDSKGTFFFSEPEPFAPLLASSLAVRGKYLIWKNGKLTVRGLQFIGSNITAAWSLTESNKGGDPNGKPSDGRSEIIYSSDGLVNSFELHYDRSLTGKFRRVLRVQDAASQTNYGARRTIKVEGRTAGQSDAEDWVESVASVGLGLFSRPLTMLSRTYDQTRVEMVPTDTVAISDDYMVDPVTGTRTVSGFPGVLLGTSFDFDKMIGAARVVMLTEIDPARFGAWGPSARVDDTSPINAGYNASTSTLTLKANEYSHSSEGTDGGSFSDGDVVHLIELSPPDPASPIEWTRTIGTMGTNSMPFTSALSSPAWDATKKYVVEHAAISSVVQAQKVESFIADDADNSTGDATNDAYLFGGVGAPVDGSPATATTQRFRRIPDTADDEGRPFSLYKYFDLILSLNNLLAEKTRNVCPQDPLVVEEAATGSSFTLVYGPIWVPFFSPARDAKVLIRGYVTAGGGGSGTGTFRVYASQSFPTGSSDTDTTYSSQVTSVDLTTTSTSAVWLTEASLTIYRSWARWPPGVWLTVEAKNSVSDALATLSAIAVSEDGY